MSARKMTDEQAAQESIRKEIEDRWVSRAKAQGLKPGSRAYKVGEVEFFAGAMAALCAAFPCKDGLMSEAVPPAWGLRIMSGRPVVERP